MESVIKWNTGEPKEIGNYLVSVKVSNHLLVTTDFYLRKGGWSLWNDYITAWCKLDDINPYKQQTER